MTLALDANGRPKPPALPLATYFVNAGLSEGDALEVERAVLARAREILASKALRDDRGTRFRYLNDAQYRIRVNADVLRDVIGELGFSRQELVEIERGMQLGLVKEEKRPTTARVIDQHGVDRTFQVEELEDRGPDGRNLARLTDVETGEKLIG